MQTLSRHQDRLLALEVQRESGELFAVTVDGVKHRVEAELVDPNTLRIVVDGNAHLVRVARVGREQHVSVNGTSYVLSPESAASSGAAAGTLANPQIIAPMPGKVLQVLVEEGQQIAEGDGLLILEAMKMENRVLAEAAGTVTKVNIAAGQMVEGGTVMMEIEYSA